MPDKVHRTANKMSDESFDIGRVLLNAEFARAFILSWPVIPETRRVYRELAGQPDNLWRPVTVICEGPVYDYNRCPAAALDVCQRRIGKLTFLLLRKRRLHTSSSMKLVLSHRLQARNIERAIIQRLISVVP